MMFGNKPQSQNDIFSLPTMAGQQPLSTDALSVPPETFNWGTGGARMTPEQLQARQAMALQNQQVDYSPVQSWTQGVARLAQNALGGYQQNQLDKEAAAQQGDRRSILAALSSGGDPSAQQNAVVAALAGTDPVAQKYALQVDERLHPKVTQPHYWEANNGSLFSIASNGQPQEVYHDPSPKVQWIMDPNGGGRFEPIPDFGQMGQPSTADDGMPMGSPLSPPPPPTLPPDFDFGGR